MLLHPGIIFEKPIPILITATVIEIMVAFLTDPFSFRNLIVIEPINKPTTIIKINENE